MTGDSFEKRIQDYRNTGAHNDAIFLEFSDRVNRIPFLRVHRDVVERNHWGTGERAFHYMWYLLIQAAAQRFAVPKLLEIGVFKGQIIALWSLLAPRLCLNVNIIGISPLRGSIARRPQSRLGHRIRMVLDSTYRRLNRDGNLYERVDYGAIIAEQFAAFELDLNEVTLVRGLSQDPEVINRLANDQFHIVYIDGDHSEAGARADIERFTRKIPRGGWLVMDDAACDCPGTAFWKGHESVTRACDAIPKQFRNILNVGHNRIYERTD